MRKSAGTRRCGSSCCLRGCLESSCANRSFDRQARYRGFMWCDRERSARPVIAPRLGRGMNEHQTGRLRTAAAAHRTGTPLSGRNEQLLQRREAAEHQALHRYSNPVLARLRQPLVVLREASVASQPAEGPLDNPAPPQDREPVLSFELRHYLKPRSRPEGLHHPLDKLACVSSVPPYHEQP